MYTLPKYRINHPHTHKSTDCTLHQQFLCIVAVFGLCTPTNVSWDLSIETDCQTSAPTPGPIRGLSNILQHNCALFCNGPCVGEWLKVGERNRPITTTKLSCQILLLTFATAKAYFFLLLDYIIPWSHNTAKMFPRISSPFDFQLSTPHLSCLLHLH